MRTTLTLDDEAAALVRQTMKRTHRSLKETINEAIKRGLAPSLKAAAPHYSTKPFDAGQLLVRDVRNIGDLLSQADEHLK